MTSQYSLGFSNIEDQMLLEDQDHQVCYLDRVSVPSQIAIDIVVVDQFTPGYQFRPTLHFLEDLYYFIEKMFTTS